VRQGRVSRSASASAALRLRPLGLTAALAMLLGCHPFPALVASDPQANAADVPKTAWIRLDFSSAWDDRAANTLALDCGGEAQDFHATRLSPTRLLVRPDAELPAGSPCVLGWSGPAGRQSLAFQVAAAGPDATVLYDRSDRSRVAPLPDDYWLVPDASTETGQRVAIPTPDRDADVVQLFGALTHDTTALDGFSPLAMIAVELSDAPDPTSLPLAPAQSLDPLASVGLFDLTPGSETYGQRVPFQLDARDDTLPGQPVTHSLVAFPSIPLAPGGRYAFVVTRRALAAGAQPFEPSAFLRGALAPAAAGEAAATAAVRQVLAPVLDALASSVSPPLRPDDLALALSIHVRSTNHLKDDLLAMRQQVAAAPPADAWIDSIQAGTPGSAISAIVRGYFWAPNWRQGKYLARDASGAPRIVKYGAVPFVLALPVAAGNGPVPVVMYQHGDEGSAEEILTGAQHLLRAGFAVVGFTDPLNRAVPDGSQQMAAVFAALLQSGHVPAYWIETYGEQLAFLRALPSIAALDALPINAPDGIPELDLARPIGYLGESFGASYGQAFLPYAPEIHAAVLMAGGERVAEQLFHQDETDPFLVALHQGLTAPYHALLSMVPSSVPHIRAPEIWAGLSLFQMIFDAQDPQNQAELLYRHPIEINGTTRKASMLVVEGLTDLFTPNEGTNSLAWTAGPIPQLSPVLHPAPFLGAASGPVRGNVDADTTAALAQYMPKDWGGYSPVLHYAPYDHADLPPSRGCEVWYEGQHCAAAASQYQQVVFLLSALHDPVPTITAADADSDADGIPDVEEMVRGTNPLAADSDGDGLPDGVELQFRLDPLDPSDAARDLDGDGLSNLAEFQLGTRMDAWDTDRDNLSDGYEVAHGTNPLLADTDGGGRSDYQELIVDKTNPLDPTDDLPIVGLSTSLVDGSGFSWMIDQQGRADGFGVAIPLDAYQSITLSASQGGTEDGRREITIGPATQGSLRLTRKVYVPKDGGFARFLDIVENTSDWSVPASLQVTRSAAAVVATSSGDAILDAADDFAVLAQSGQPPLVAYSFSGPGAALQPIPSFVPGSYLSVVYPLVVPPRGRAIAMSFAAHGSSQAGALALAEALRDLGDGALAGLSSAERKAIVNFSCAPDADGDGILDFDEIALGTDPQNPDSDGDGLTDGFEVDHGFDPLHAGETHLDPDGDGLDNLGEQAAGTDPLVADTDGDGLNDGREIQLGTSPLHVDTDKDGLSDAQEVALGTNPLDAAGDADGDGLRDADEVLIYHTNPLAADTDGDGLRDDVELAHGLNPLDATDAAADFDGDGLSNAREIALGTSYWEFDTDRDGLGDGEEVALGTDPLLPDTDGGGRSDEREVVLDGTNPLDPSDDLPLLALPIEVVGGDGSRWVIGTAGDLESDGFDEGAGLGTLLGNSWPYDVTKRPDGREFNVLFSDWWGYARVRRKIFVPADGAFVRILDIVENLSDAEINTWLGLDSNVRSDAATELVATSSGGASVGPDDDWVVTDDADGSGAPSAVLVLAGPGAAQRRSGIAQFTDFIPTDYWITIPPHGRWMLLTFLAQANTRADAIAMATALHDLPESALTGLSDAERAAIVNFTVPPSGAP